tara:strand:- start:23512 stop:25377 length:1866 start_codon:yes stop_codon:yes gene_type:complete
MENTLNKIKKANKLQQNKKFDEAEIIYKDILKNIPNHPDANHNLAILLITKKNIKEAKRYINELIKTDYPVAEYYFTASSYFKITKDYKRSLNLIDKAIDLSNKENIHKSYYAKAQLCKILDRYDESFSLFKKCYELDPKNPIILNSYGVGLCTKGMFIESIPIFKQVIELAPEFFDGYSNLGLALQKTNRIEESSNAYEKAFKINPKNLMLNINIGSLHQQKRDAKKALEYYENAKKIDPFFPQIYNNLGIIYGEIGEKQKAFEHYRQALKLDPDYVKAFRHISYTNLLKKDDPIIINMIKKYLDKNTSKDDKVEIAFGLGNFFEYYKDYKKAFKFFKEGNDFIKEINGKYDFQKVKRGIKKMLVKYPKKITSNLNTSFSPIFILGMPRSGSTILENVISNHPNIDAMGELTGINDLATKSKKNNKFWPDVLDEFNSDDLNFLQNLYINNVKEFSPKVKRIFTDKMPYNFLYLGFIKSIFPNSKIIYTSRGSIDNCLSVYSLKLLGEHKYSHDLLDLSNYYNLHIEIMEHWFNIFPNEIYHFKYEEFVNNPKDMTKKLFKYLEIDYIENLERFDLNSSIVRTASNHQVRDRVNSSSIEKWKNYENELSELINNLNKDTYN